MITACFHQCFTRAVFAQRAAMVGRVLAVFLVLLLSAQNAKAQWILQAGLVDQQIHRGIDLIYNMDFASADRTFDSVIYEEPKHPAGYFYRATVMFWRAITNPDNTTYDDEYRAWLQKAIDKADTLLDKNPKDIAGLFYKGGAIGMRARIYEYRLNASDAMDIVQLILGDAKRGVDYLNQLEDIIPDNSDVLFGRGVYNYYVESEKEQNPTLAPAIGMMFPPGNKQAGLAMLEMAAKNAVYAKVEAQFELMHIDYALEHKYQEAYALAKELASKYPNNVQFLHYLGFCAVTENNVPLYDSVYRVMLARARERRDAYTIRQAREAMYFIGLAQMKPANGNMDTALYYFYNSDLLSRKIEQPDKFDWWVTETELNMGEAYDRKGDRKNAVLMYRRVLGLPEYQNAHAEATKYLATPYKR
jgi:tetratricopeptide (TPR) repeat protein